MALNVQAGTVSAPASNGQTASISLPAGFDPKALILCATGQTAAGGSATINFRTGVGFVTNDGGSRQYANAAWFDTDAATTMNIGAQADTTSGLFLLSAASGGTALSCTATTWSDTSIVLTFGTTLSGAVVGYLALGGSDVSAARAGMHTSTSGAATVDTTIVSGFGQPDLLLFLPTIYVATVNADHMVGMGAAVSATERAHAALFADHGNTTSTLGAYNGGRAFSHLFLSTNPAIDAEADLSARASWPTDGFQITYTGTTAASYLVPYLALKGTFQKKVTSFLTLAAGSPQDVAAGFTPKAALTFGNYNIASSPATVATAGGFLGGFNLGLTDLTNEVMIGGLDDDGQGTMFCMGRLSTTRFLHVEDVPTASAVGTSGGEINASASGSDLRLTYAVLEPVGSRYQGLVILGDAPPEIPLVMAPMRR